MGFEVITFLTQKILKKLFFPIVRKIDRVARRD
jgi:hypothetical protein